MKHRFIATLAIAACSLPALAQGVEYAGIKLADNDSSANGYALPEGSSVINDTELTYTEGWYHERLLPRRIGRFCNTRSTSTGPGATASYVFSGAGSIKWHGAPSDASAEVFIDGRSKGVVVCSGSDGILFDSGELAPGRHSFAIEAKTGNVEIDFIEYTTAKASSYTIDSGNSSFIYYTSGFSLDPKSLNKETSTLSAKDKDEMFEIYFRGTSLKCYGEKGPDGGSLSLYVKGEKVREVSLEASEESGGARLFVLEGLPADEGNMVRGIVGPKAGKVALESFEVEDPACLMVEMNLNTDLELAQMVRHERTASSPENWTPVSYGATAPETGITLGEGVLRTAFDRNINYLKDCLGKPNWVDDKDQDRIWIDMLYASNEGRMLGGMGHTLRWADVPEFDKAIEDILEAVDRRQFANGNGYLMPYGHETYNISKDTWPGIMRDEQKNYDRAMFTKGMLAAGRAGHERGYTLLRPFYDWFNSSEQYLPNMLLGSMGIQGSIAGPMVYHSPVGVPADIQTNMKYYDMDWWLEALGERIPEAIWRFTLNRPHNYILTSLCALVDIYRATGEEKYLSAALGGWDIYHNYYQLPGGAITICEHFECRPWTHTLKNLPNNIYETCAGVFWIDLNHRFLQLWPENELYASHIEQELYNIVIPAQGEDGKIRYFNHLNESKYPPMCYNTCCEIQATAFYGMMPEYLYSVAEDGIYVNTFAQSESEFEIGGKKVKLTMDTTFPYSGDVSLKVSAEEPVPMKLRLRIPSWTEGKVKVYVNGKVEAVGVPGSFLTMDREWKDGDSISVSFPMRLRREKYTGTTKIEGATRYGFLYGPMLMAVTGPIMEVLQAPDERSIAFDMSVADFENRLRPTSDPCVFEIEGCPGYTLRPYFSFQNGTFTCFPGFRN
ncbi:MAG: glycoside hydrolase family 127 protein [Bacteroidales bacterium]|nr:glycoside hydrolase family 127 protein [Bacteroidales bacterium]